MSTREQVIDFIEQEHIRIAFTPSFNYSPILGFKLTNINHNTSDSFSVASVDEAENLAISFISTLQKGNIFISNDYDENKKLFLRVKVILPS